MLTGENDALGSIMLRHRRRGSANNPLEKRGLASGK